MKKLIFLIILYPLSFCFAEGPLFSHKEPEKQQEFENVYQNIRHFQGLNLEWIEISTSGAVSMSAYGAGTATFDASGNITSVSDERLKNIEKKFNRGLKEVIKVQPIVYKWKQESGWDTKHSYVGFSAQNVNKQIPEATFKNKDGFYTLQDRALMATMVNAIKELNIKINKLEDEIDLLKVK